MNFLIKKFSEKKPLGVLFGISFFAFLFLISSFSIPEIANSAAGVPKIINFQGRLMNSSGTLLGGSSGTDYCYKFAIYDASTGGTKLWPTGTPTTMTISTRDGVFDAAVGGAGGDTLDYDFQTSDTTFMDVQVSAIGAGNCTSGDESFETLSPRPQIVSAAYAINSGTVQGFTPAQSATNNQIPALTSGELILGHATAAGLRATGSNVLTLQNGVTGNLQFFSSSNRITSSGALTIAGTLTAGSGGEVITLSTGKIDADALTLATSGTTGSTSSRSGLQTSSDGLALLMGCADNEILKWTDASGWSCATDDGGGSSSWNSITNPTGSQALTFDDGEVTTWTINSDTETGLTMNANSLTSGKGLSIASSATAFTGNIASFTLSGSNASNTGSVVLIDNTGTASANTGLKINHYATGTGNLALRIDDESADTTPIIIDGDGRLGIGTTTIEGTTERLFQVGSPTYRGNSATYGEIVTKGLTDFTALTGIQDTFFYDTTADSDGGRWIDWATTDQLSWYTESVDDSPSDPCNIATDDRCYSSSFPRKALLVVTTDTLYIFDVTNNIMWMKFEQNASEYALGVDTDNDPTSVTAKNGVIYVGAKGTASGGLYAFDFVNDRMWNYNATHRASSDVGIGGRNGAVSYASDVNTKLQLDPVGVSAEWMNVNDVDVQLINGSNTSITIGAGTTSSPQNGKTLVALATDSGMTVIDISGQTLLQYSDVTGNDYTAVALSTQGDLYGLNTTNDQLEKWTDVDSDKASEVNGSFTVKYDETQATSPQIAPSTPDMIAGAPDALEVISKGSLAQLTAANAQSDLIYVGHSLGLAEIHDHSTPSAGWSKFTDTTRQKGFSSSYVDMYLTLDDTSGTQAQDWGAANTDMAIKGTPSLAQTGVRNKSILFDNTDDYLCSDANADNTCDVDGAFAVTTVGWTLELWFRHSTSLPATPDVIFEKCVTAVPAAATGCVAAYMTTTGAIGVGIDDDASWTRGTTYDITATSSILYNDDKWHHLVLTRTNANDLDVYIDGVPQNLSTGTGLTTTIDGSQIVTFGAGCVLVTTANCGAAENFWDGYIDDINFMVGTTTQATLTPAQVRYWYNDARSTVNKRVINVTNATSATSNTITDTGETWIPNEFTGLLVTLTGDTGSGQTRRIISNTTDTITVNPAWSTVPDTTTDFEVDPEALFGSSNAVTAIGITKESPLGQARQMCVGTNDGSDGGGVTCYNHQAGPNIVADIYHSDTEQVDDYGTEWTGTNYDDIRSIDISGRAMVLSSEAGFLTETSDVRLGQGLDYISNQLSNIRLELLNDGIFAAGSLGVEVGFIGGADLAEYYYSNNPLEAGDVVAIQPDQPAGIDKSVSRYQKNLLGVVSTQPGLILGPKEENAYPIALSGRVPVKITDENGSIHVGDLLTSSSRPGYAMRATSAGAVIGRVLNEPELMTSCDALLPNIAEAIGDGPGVTGNPEQNIEQESNEILNKEPVVHTDYSIGPKCGYAMLFVGLGESLGKNVEILAKEFGALNNNQLTIDGITTAMSSQDSIMGFLRASKANLLVDSLLPESIFADRIAAGLEILTPTLYVDSILTSSGDTITIGSPVEFTLPPIFNKDTAGFAIIKQGDKRVRVTFDQPYTTTPVVTSNMTFEVTDNIDEISFASIFEQNIQYVVTAKDQTGFTILINKSAPRNIRFSWIALGVRDPKVIESTIDGITIESPIINTPTPPEEQIPIVDQPIEIEQIGDTIETIVDDSVESNIVENTTSFEENVDVEQ